jgi:predicted nucleotidyltransferase
MENAPDSGLSVGERAVLERFVSVIEDRLGEHLYAVWLFGSRARGDADRAEDSDVDLLVLTDDASWPAKEAIRASLSEAARELTLEPEGWAFSIHIQTPEWLRQRREIESFFIAEVDRDKVVLSGRA